MIGLFLFKVALFTISMFFLVEYIFLSPVDTRLGALLILLITGLIVLFFAAARSYDVEKCEKCQMPLSTNPLRTISAF
jgi:hypothetical protein